MEENNQPQQKKNKWKIYLVLGISSIIVGCIIYLLYDANQENKRAAEEYRKLLLEEKSASANLSSQLLSAQKQIKLLSTYWPLTSEMIQRDEARKNLKYEPGEFAIMKIDSTKVLVVDIIAGGDTYNYTLEYEIQYPNKTYGRISPQLVY